MRLPAPIARTIHAAARGRETLKRSGGAAGIRRASTSRLVPHTDSAEASAAWAGQPDPGAVPNLTALVYELLDAHADTAELAAKLPYEPYWAAHLEYLKALQRKSRETLAQSLSELMP